MMGKTNYAAWIYRARIPVHSHLFNVAGGEETEG